jgi:steroid delta-isomerase-like uncharacterized protein
MRRFAGGHVVRSLLILCGVLVGLAGCEDPGQAIEAENRRIVSEIIREAWNEGNLEVFAESFASDFVYRDPAAPTATDLDSYRAFVSGILTRWPERSLRIEDMISENDKVVVKYEFRGVRSEVGTDEGPGTEATVSHPGIQIYRISEGKVVELDDIWDALGAYQQAGYELVLSEGQDRQ